MKKEKTNLLEVIPVVKAHITTQNENGLCTITYPRFKSRLMIKYILPKGKSNSIEVQFEKHGSAVWRLIDGKRSISQIIELLANHFKDEENYEYRITSFISSLHKSHYITYLI